MNLSEPLPETPVETQQSLDSEQGRRVTALNIAKPLLTHTGIASRTPPEVSDLIRLAAWIVSGEDEPLYPYSEPDGTVHLGPAVLMKPDGYLWVNDVPYEPSADDSDDDQVGGTDA